MNGQMYTVKMVTTTLSVMRELRQSSCCALATQLCLPQYGAWHHFGTSTELLVKQGFLLSFYHVEIVTVSQ